MASWCLQGQVADIRKRRRRPAGGDVQQSVAELLQHSAGGYRLGMRTLELGGLAAGHSEIRDVVGPLLHELCRRTGFVGHLAVLDGREVVFLDKVGGRFAANLPTRLGGRMPAHTTAVGKAILASLDPHHIDATYRVRLPVRTPRSIRTTAGCTTSWNGSAGGTVLPWTTRNP